MTVCPDNRDCKLTASDQMSQFDLKSSGVLLPMRTWNLTTFLTPRPHRVCQRITHSFYDILHLHQCMFWGWNQSAIMVAHMHFSVNTSMHTSLPHYFARVKLDVVCCDLGVRVRSRTRCGPGVTHTNNPHQQLDLENFRSTRGQGNNFVASSQQTNLIKPVTKP